MKGAALGNFIARAYRDRLLALTSAEMPAQSHWERARNPRRVCRNEECLSARILSITDESGEHDELFQFTPDCEKCPHCGRDTREDYNDGAKVDDGRSLYGLRFYNPKYNASAELVTPAMVDDVFIKAGDVGKPLGESGDVGLITLRAAYKNSSPVATLRHTVPAIDGACGVSSVETIMTAIGLSMRFVSQSSKVATYLLEDVREGGAK